MSLSALFARLTPALITPQAIRMEIYHLGSRHRGETLPGALMELKSRTLSPARSRLLRAVVNHLRREQRSRAS